MRDDEYDGNPPLSSSDREFNKRFGTILKRIERAKAKEAQAGASKQNTDLKHGFELDPDSNNARPGPDKAWKESTRIEPTERTLYTFKSYIVDDGNKEAYEMATQWSLKQKKGIFFFGRSGTGKTHLLKALINRTFCPGIRFWYVDTKQIISEILGKDQWTDKQANTFEKERIAIKKYSEPELLVLDDIQRIKATDFQNDLLKDLLDARLQPGKITFAACDLGREDIRNHFHSRVLDRLNALCVPVLLRGESKRGRL